MMDYLKENMVETTENTEKSFGYEELLLIGEACEHYLNYTDLPEDYVDCLEEVLQKVHYPCLPEKDEVKQFSEFTTDELLVIGDSCWEADDCWDNTMEKQTQLREIMEKFDHNDLQKNRPDYLDVDLYEKYKESLENGELEEEDVEESDVDR